MSNKMIQQFLRRFNIGERYMCKKKKKKYISALQVFNMHALLSQNDFHFLYIYVAQ